jgi:transcriptional regulator with XRE-family HTH domain
MITNERQYRITKAEAKRFEKAIEAAKAAAPGEGIHPDLHNAMIEGMQSQLDDLRSELRHYEALRTGKITKRALTSLDELPTALIEGRIARRLTQKELARRVGLPEQQIQRYEANRYAGANLERLQEVADAVGIRLAKTVEYDVRDDAKRSSSVARARTSLSRGRRLRSAVTSGRSVAAAKRTTGVKTRSSASATRTKTAKTAPAKARRASSTKSKTKSRASRPTARRKGSSTKRR